MFGDLAAILEARRNMLWLVFASAQHRATLPDWENDARAMVARFRLEFGRRRDDADFLALVEELRTASPEFHRWWAEQDVARPPVATKKFHSPRHGTMTFEQTNFVADETAELRLTVYTPLDPRTRRHRRQAAQRVGGRKTSPEEFPMKFPSVCPEIPVSDLGAAVATIASGWDSASTGWRTISVSPACRAAAAGCSCRRLRSAKGSA